MSRKGAPQHGDEFMENDIKMKKRRAFSDYSVTKAQGSLHVGS